MRLSFRKVPAEHWQGKLDRAQAAPGNNETFGDLRCQIISDYLLWCGSLVKVSRAAIWKYWQLKEKTNVTAESTC